MAPVHTVAEPGQEAAEVAREWGWSCPPDSVLDLARQTRAGADTRGPVATGRAEAGIVQTERALALRNGYPCYSPLSLIAIHPCMSEPAVMRRAEEMDAAVMQIEGTTPVIVFATFGALISFRSLGRGERMADPIMRALGRQPLLGLAARDEISAVLKTVRSSDAAEAANDATNIWLAESSENTSRPEHREVSRLIDHALNEQATDISLSPLRSGELFVQLRRFGSLVSPTAVSPRMSAELASRVVNLLQSRSGANPSNTVQRFPTDGRITYRSNVGEAYLRLSFIPLNHLGEMRNLASVSIRILPRKEESLRLAELNLSAEVIEQMRFALQLSQGMVLVVGPTNTGKSTTIAGAIGEHVGIFGDSQKRLSVEDPIERFVCGIRQINVPPVAAARDEDERFSVVLRAIKRHDPDLIWVGEVRDKMTADLCVAAASSGHLVLSTLHANDTIMGFDVLAKTVEAEKRFQLADGLSLIVSQRLVRTLCPHCKEEGTPKEVDEMLFQRYMHVLGENCSLPETIAAANPKGCEYCSHTGYTGVLPINEVLPFTRAAKDAAIAMAGGANRRDVLAKARTVTLLESGMALVRARSVDFKDVLV